MIAAIIMAAGESRRLQTPKQFVRFKDRSLIEHTIKCAVDSACGKIVVVVGAYKERVIKKISSQPVEIIPNDRWKEGKASSICAGLNAVMSMAQRVQAVIILTCDQPYLTTALLDQMIKTYKSGGCGIVACKYSDTVGVPAIIPGSFFHELLSLTNDQGAKDIITANLKTTQIILFPKGDVDIDTLDDISELISAQNDNDRLSID